MMLPLRNDGAGLTVRMKLNLPVGFPYCCGTSRILFSFFHTRVRGQSGVSCADNFVLVPQCLGPCGKSWRRESQLLDSTNCMGWAYGSSLVGCQA